MSHRVANVKKIRRTIKATVLVKLKPKRMKLELDDGRFDSIAFFRSVCSGVVTQLSSPIDGVIIEVKNVSVPIW